jgi:uncharacterized C2H2 Zn-finger protein
MDLNIEKVLETTANYLHKIKHIVVSLPNNTKRQNGKHNENEHSSGSPHSKHNTKSHKTHQCSYCSKQLPNQQSLLQHIKLLHNTEQTASVYECPHCFRRFDQGRELSGHLLRKHFDQQIQQEQDEKVFICPFTSMIFGRELQLLEHVLTQHHYSKPRQVSRADQLKDDSSNEPKALQGIKRPFVRGKTRIMKDFEFLVTSSALIATLNQNPPTIWPCTSSMHMDNK